MRTVSFINLKGGVGKTTISTNLAYILAESWNAKILFIDNDKQGNASTWFNADTEKPTITNILLDGTPASEVIQHTRYPNIDLIPADIGLIEANFKGIKEKKKRQDNILKNAMEEVRGNYQFCIIDNPPDINLSVFNTFVLTDDVIIVTTPEIESLSGVYRIVEQLAIAQKFNPSLSVMGVLLNMYVCTDMTFKFQDEIEMRYPVFDSHIRFATSFAKGKMNDARMLKRAIHEVAANTGIARDLYAFSEEFMRIILKDINGGKQ